MFRVALLLGLLATVGCASAPPNPEASALNRKLRYREGAIDRFCLDQEQVTSAAAIRDCRYYSTRARFTLRGKVYSQPDLAQQAVRVCGLPKATISARATANYNRQVAACYRQVFSLEAKKH